MGAATGDDGEGRPAARPDDAAAGRSTPHTADPATAPTTAPTTGHDAGHLDAAEHVDTPAEVQAAATTQRRTALGYALVFLMVTGAVPVLTLTLPWWSEARLAGGMSPNFVVAGIGLYAFFLALGTAAATLATSIEDRMLGDPDPDPADHP